MSPNSCDPPGSDLQPPQRLRYTLVILNKFGALIDIQTIYAINDAEATILGKTLSQDNAFELWLGFQRVSYFTGTVH
ncbi:hypothetical protein [Methylobacterium currus]|uniref:hypothetical protein n=1 Tax=Methylobacterium currus TaxID=2051553 RepID=UPI000F4D30EF|nr:hypothetical protein [Methylobacterium currus]